MKTIKVTVGKEESLKISPFIDTVNKNEDSAAYQFDKTSFILATVNECGIAYYEAVISGTFEDYNIELIK